MQNPTFGPVGQRSRSQSRSNLKSCLVHNFAMPDGILTKLGTGILLMDVKCRTQLFRPVGQRSRSHSRSNFKSCQVHNFAMPDGILTKLGTGILLMDLKCRT